MKIFSKLNNLQFIIAISSILLAIIPMTYTSYSLYSRYSDELIVNSQVFTSQIMDQLRFNIDEYLRNATTTNEDIEKILNNSNFMIDSTFRTEVNSYFSSRNDIVSINIYDEHGNMEFDLPGKTLRTSYDIQDEVWFEPMLTGNSLYYFSKPHVQYTYSNDQRWVISVVKMINIGQGNELKKGLLKVDISIKQLDDLCKSLNLGGSGYVFITDSDNSIIYHPQQALIYAGLKEEIVPGKFEQSIQLETPQGFEVISITKSLSFVDWKLVGVTHIDAITKNNSRILSEVLVIIPIIVFAIILISWFISGMITSPIRELESKMRRVQKGDFKALVNLEYGEKEVVELANSYNAMVVKIEDLMRKNKEEHEAKRQSELNALQAQINPHFLYNTLDSIMWMAESGQNEEVVDMVTALARLFRISISKGQKRIFVSEELEHARNYLLIQKRRYKEKFQFHIESNEEIDNLITLKLILQPIIENAIYHGIEYMVDEGEIKISVIATKDKLIYTVEDNGLGMNEETRLSLLHSSEGVEPTKGGSGVGVRNVDERIKLSYGDDYGLEIESVIEEGTTVRIVLPRIEGDR